VTRSFRHSEFPPELLREHKRQSVSVVLPARDVAETIGSIVERIRGLGDLVDQVLVVDAASADGTATVAAAAGAEVCQEAELMPEFGPVLGKGDAMWRGLAAARGELVVYLDSDTRDFPAHFVTGMLGPLLVKEGVEFVKATYARDAGRVTELTARPLLSALYGDLAGFRQPLAGEVAAPRRVLERLPFRTGYAIEAGMLLDAREQVGVGAMAQVDLGERINHHQPLSALAPMAAAVVETVCERLHREDRLLDAVETRTVERPPLASLRAAV
jgi:glucosyl-3-phosphoglycerate synthase